MKELRSIKHMSTFSPQQIRRALKTLTFLSILSVGLGTCGIGNGSMYFSELEPPSMEDSPFSGLSATGEKSAKKLTDIIWHTPHRKPLGILNMGVSFLLMFGGIQLWLKRKQATWWITQAAIANMIWIAADTGAKAVQVLDHQKEILTAFRLDVSEAKEEKSPSETTESPANNTPTESTPQAPTEKVIISSYLGSLIGWGFFQIVFFSWIIWRIRQADIQFLLEPNRTTP